MATPAANAQAGGGGGGSPNPQQAALDLVRPLRPILAGFNHRNRNQHRGARWWAAFGMLRRHLDKLADDLEASIASGGKSAGRKRKRGEGGGDGAPEDGPAETRARWVRDVLVPECYV
jgi:ribonuclease MRP protein subunit RMP1